MLSKKPNGLSAQMWDLLTINSMQSGVLSEVLPQIMSSDVHANLRSIAILREKGYVDLHPMYAGNFRSSRAMVDSLVRGWANRLLNLRAIH